MSACQPVKQQPSVTIRKASPLIKALKDSEQRSNNIKIIIMKVLIISHEPPVNFLV